MKLTTLIISFLLIACTSKDSITPTTGIVGKWSPTYITQTKNADGNWEPFHTINTFAPLPVYEFTADGRFLRDGKDGADCCTSGSKYTVVDNKITFIQMLPCAMMCLACDNWTVTEIKNDTLILEECARVRNKFVRIK